MTDVAIGAQPRRPQLRIACEECRRKRIKCDRGTPQCTSCATSGKTCIVRDDCPRRGPKKGYLKTLQNKIEDLQARLNEQQEASATETRTCSPSQEEVNSDNDNGSSMDNNEIQSTATPITLGDIQLWTQPLEVPFPMMQPGPWDCIENPFPSSDFPVLDHTQEPAPFAVGVGLDITPMMHNDLDQLYFDRAYMFAPILQAHRYRSWSKQPNKSKQQTCLQYAMWTLAASLSSQFQVAVRQLYSEARQLLHIIESEEPCHQVSIEQAQAWLLLAIYELTCEDYHRWMMSAGTAFRLIQMMRLYELDIHQSLYTTQAQEQYSAQLSPSGQIQDDWIDVETKRRTFWLAYTIDRFTSMVDGLHMFFNDRMIRTLLPAPEANFASGRPKEMSFLTDMVRDADIERLDEDLSSFTETVIVAHICGRVLEHKQRPLARTRDNNVEFCRRHRCINALLAQRVAMLRMHASVEHLDPVLTFTALAAHISVLMLYDFIESKPLGTKAQATQLTKALHAEYQQQALDAVADIPPLVFALDQHFQTHPLTPILLLLGARFSQSHPELNDVSNKLMPCIITRLQASVNLNRLSQSFLQLIGPQTDIYGAFT
ncbi:putative Zn(II)2Cys6 transcription factor [Daldinia vernicosa]|uniref:putative Zn(II)2Cys6 transcription factor n=1 Tax=Daldinia vernicosa TaxID=114800 RepID=UPI002007CE46|nr:putative Zn(II)2Cys6 transcription factor [Daldinia vernicosa]KAI0849454.1 putative Zn(II)2Cys6 transcription factor [Daldinia vernicosa]